MLQWFRHFSITSRTSRTWTCWWLRAFVEDDLFWKPDTTRTARSFTMFSTRNLQQSASGPPTKHKDHLCIGGSSTCGATRSRLKILRRFFVRPAGLAWRTVGRRVCGSRPGLPTGAKSAHSDIAPNGRYALQIACHAMNAMLFSETLSLHGSYSFGHSNVENSTWFAPP